MTRGNPARICRAIHDPEPLVHPLRVTAGRNVSADAGLVVSLQNVPKMLGELSPSFPPVHSGAWAIGTGEDKSRIFGPLCAGAVRREWAPDAFMVSFKLETDDDLVLSKVRRTRVLPALSAQPGHTAAAPPTPPAAPGSPSARPSAR